MERNKSLETLRGPGTGLAPIFSDRVASAEEMALGGSGSNSPAHHVLHTSSSGPDVTWASTNNLQDLVMPPSDAPAFSKAKAKDPLFGSQATMNDSDTDGDNNTNRPGTEEFHKFSERQLTAEVIFCASMGNLKRMKTILKRANKDISKETFADYDLRTPLHVAASDGSVGVTNWLIEQGVDLNPADRWGMTPLEGAVFGNHQDIIAMLQHAGGKIRDRETGTLLPIEESHVAASAAKDAKILTSDTMAWEIPDEELSDRVEVGAGAFGVVMRTRWRGTVIAMKQLHRHLHHDEVAKAEFRTELKLMRQLHHPHIVQFLGTSVDPGTGLVSLCFEFMHKGSLDQMFRRMYNSETGAPNITLAEMVEMALDVARGMAYLHGRKPLPVIHRDLKPGNLMLTRAGRVKIGDFGLSKTMSVRHKMPQNLHENFSMTGETGSYRYMAPEVFRHEFYGTSVDVYAASMIYYQLFSFQQPFYGINPVDAAKLASMESLRPTMQKDLMPAPLARVVRAMWDADESKRPTFTQLIEILEPIASEYAAEEERRANKACCVVS
jgi:hypothetical protein